MTQRHKELRNKPPVIGSMVDVPTLHPESDYDPVIKNKWCGKQRGLVIELVESGDYDHPDDPLVCLEIVGEDGTRYAWFLASGIRAGELDDPEFQLSADAMVSEHRPEIPDDPTRLYDGYVFVFFPEDESWHAWKRYRGSLAD